MSTAGISLVGFMDEQAALTHLLTQCVPADPMDAALRQVWLDARQRLGPAITNAGNPEILPIPTAQQGHIATLIQTPRMQEAIAQMPGLAFHLVEIDPLLAFQFTVDLERSAHHCQTLATPPTLDQLMPICLPFAAPPEQVAVQVQQNSMLVKARCLNLKLFQQGWFPQVNDMYVAGAIVGLSLPMAHVVRLNGKCYLHNGFHRVVGAKRAGATHVPCLFRDVADPGAAGINPPGTFGVDLLESDNPPTLAHFAGGRGCNVQLRASSRVIHISWSEYVVHDE